MRPDQHKARFSERSKTAQKQSQLSTNSEKNFRSIQSGKSGYGPRRVGHGGLQGPVLGHLQKHLHREHTAVRGQDLPHGLGYSNKQAASSGGLNGNTRGVQNHRKRSEIWGKIPLHTVASVRWPFSFVLRPKQTHNERYKLLIKINDRGILGDGGLLPGDSRLFVGIWPHVCDQRFCTTLNACNAFTN